MLLSADALPASPQTPLPAGTPKVRTVVPTGSLAQKATRGFAWLLIQTVASRGVQFVSEIILAWWLLPKAFGLRSEAMTVFAFASLLQEYGVTQVLVHRHRSLAKWANPAFWLSLTIGVLGGIVIAGLAPLVARWYGAASLTGMILILAVRSPLATVASVSYAQLQADLRYKTLAIINVLVVIVTAVSGVICAYFGLGAYSFIWPLLFGAIARTAMFWGMAPPRVKPNLEIRRWKYLTGDSGMMLLASVLFTLTSQGDYMTLGVLYKTSDGPAPLVGTYFFGFMLCVQTTQFITTSLANVLLPTLSKLQNEPDRLKTAFLRTTKLLAIFGVFACLLQTAVAAPMVQAILHVKNDPGKWLAAVPILQVISIAMALQLFNMPAQSLIQAQGRFRTLLRLAIFCPICFFALIWLAACTGVRPTGQIRSAGLEHLLASMFGQHVDVSVMVAIAVVVYCLITGPFFLWVAIRPLRGSWRDIWPIYLWPIGTSSLAIAVGMLAGYPLPATPFGNWARLIVVPLASVIVYAPMVRVTAPDAWADVVSRLTGLVKRRSH